MHESSCQIYQIQNLKSLSSGLDCLRSEAQSGLGAPSLEQLAMFSFCGSCLKARRVSWWENPPAWLVRYFFHGIMQDWYTRLVLTYWYGVTLSHVGHQICSDLWANNHSFLTIRLEPFVWTCQLPPTHLVPTAVLTLVYGTQRVVARILYNVYPSSLEPKMVIPSSPHVLCQVSENPLG